MAMRLRDYAKLLPDYIKGALSPAQKKRLEKALAESEELRRERNSLRDYYSFLESSAPEQVPDHFIEGIRERLEKPSFRSALAGLFHSPMRIKLPIELAGIAAAFIMVFLLYAPEDIEKTGRISDEQRMSQNPAAKIESGTATHKSPVTDTAESAGAPPLSAAPPAAKKNVRAESNPVSGSGLNEHEHTQISNAAPARTTGDSLLKKKPHIAKRRDVSPGELAGSTPQMPVAAAAPAPDSPSPALDEQEASARDNAKKAGAANAAAKRNKQQAPPLDPSPVRQSSSMKTARRQSIARKSIEESKKSLKSESVARLRQSLVATSAPGSPDSSAAVVPTNTETPPIPAQLHQIIEQFDAHIERVTAAASADSMRVLLGVPADSADSLSSTLTRKNFVHHSAKSSAFVNSKSDRVYVWILLPGTPEP